MTTCAAFPLGDQHIIDRERKEIIVDVLREQVKKLKDELSIARRLDWIRRGLYGATERKGAEFVANPCGAGFQWRNALRTATIVALGYYLLRKAGILGFCS